MTAGTTAGEFHEYESWMNGPMLGFDLETTGVDRFDDVPVSAALVYVEGGKVVSQDYFLIDPGRPIPAGASEIHGISTEQAQEEGMALEDAIAKLYEAISEAKARSCPIAGMNLSYDLTMLAVQAFEHLGHFLDADGLYVLDTLVIDRHVDRYRKGRRTLVHLAEHYGVDLSDAHNAAGDAKAALSVIEAQVRRYPELERMTLGELTLEQARWHREWATSYSSYRTANGQSPLDASEFEWPIARRRHVGATPVDAPVDAGAPREAERSPSAPLVSEPSSEAGEEEPGSVFMEDHQEDPPVMSDMEMVVADPLRAELARCAGMEVVSELSYRASGLHLPMSASYGRFHRVYDMGTYSSLWFQPAARVPAMHLILPAPAEHALELYWALSCEEGRNQVIVTVPLGALPEGCVVTGNYHGVLIGICTTPVEDFGIGVDFVTCDLPKDFPWACWAEAMSLPPLAELLYRGDLPSGECLIGQLSLGATGEMPGASNDGVGI